MDLIDTSNSDSTTLKQKQQRINLEAHSSSIEHVLQNISSSAQGLSLGQVQQRCAIFGYNQLPETKPVTLLKIFSRQFLNPLIYILLVAAVVSLFISELSDAIFIGIVLLVNSIVGTIQEFSAQKSASSLKQLITQTAHVIRNGENFEINARELVPGDIVLLESGKKVPADLRLIDSYGLEMDVSLLTGESMPVAHNAELILAEDTVTADRINIAYTGTLVTRGRATGVVIATGQETQLGQIAEDVLARRQVKPPLMLRMEKFSMRISIIMGLMVIILGAISLSRGMPFTDMLLMSAALAVAAIPEGLPVAMTIALSISMRRMAKKNVIVRKLVTVEALGSCTYIATDKTGTLTVNQLTVRKLLTPDGVSFKVSGEGLQPDGEITPVTGELTEPQKLWLDRVCKTVTLANEAYIGKRNGQWLHQGDTVDVAMLVLAHKWKFVRPILLEQYPQLDTIPYESIDQFSASLNRDNQHHLVSIKGAMERLLPMCSHMASLSGDVPVDVPCIEQLAHQMAEQGYRVMAVVSGYLEKNTSERLAINALRDLTFLGLVGMNDPLRKEASAAIRQCHDAGIKVAMLTGDHPVTALAIGRELSLASDKTPVITGHDLKQAAGSIEDFDALTNRSAIFARVEPHQKLGIVQSLQRNGHFVAVTGDGANDAPALRAAHVGVAMGKSGTDVARETADMILTDDNFSSIVSGIEEGRIAYANVRKVILLLLTTGASELILFVLSLIAGLPLPLTAVQLLWLNLVTNGIQDVALAFEPGEGDELKRSPRKPNEPVFNRLMIERVLSVSIVIGTVSFLAFDWLLRHGYSIDQARNSILLLMVLFENVHVFNSRSETRSVFTHNPLRNLFLLLGTIGAQLVHIGAMYTPGLREVLDIQPVGLASWFTLLQLALIALLASELHKAAWHLRYK
ncbi:MAG: HAD-IC family P-type ATPase [Gammaproteobacteria bacterium]